MPRAITARTSRSTTSTSTTSPTHSYERYLYEWNFGDVNPPVHAFATLFMQNLESDLGWVDLPFLREGFARLLLNFTWWVNRKDPSGRNAFEGGFLGLDNIGVFDRSAALPTQPIPDASTAREARGVREPQSSP